MRYISTRGQAPIRDFAGVLLAGLAEDGGIYVPESWPHFSPADWRAMRGLPYHALAARVIQPFIGDAIPSATLADAVPRRLRRLRPSGRRAAGPARHRPVRAGAVPRSDAVVQGHGAAAARSAVRPRAGGPRCACDHRRRHVGRYGLGRDRGLRRTRSHRHRLPAPARSHQRSAASADDHGDGAERRQHRDRGHVRRLPGPGEGDVRRCAVPPGDAAVGDELDQLGAHRGAGAVLRCGRAGVRRARPRGGVQRADRQFRQRARGLGGAAHGPAGGAADRRFQSQRHPGAVPRRRTTCRSPRSSRACRPAWTSRSVPTSSACCSNCWSAMRARRRLRWRSSAAPGRMDVPDAAWHRCRTVFHGFRLDDAGTEADDRPTARGDRLSGRSAHRDRHRRGARPIRRRTA